MTFAADPADFGAGNSNTSTSSSITDDAATVLRLPGVAVAAMSSIGAGAIHSAAIGVHAEHSGLARIFVAVAVLQLGVGLLALLRPNRLVAGTALLVNAGALAGWLVTRITGISWIGGLEVREAPQFADTAAAALAAIAIGGSLAAILIGWHQARVPRMMFPALLAAALVIPAMTTAGTHAHSEGTAAHGHDDGTAAAGDDHGDDHGDGASVAGAAGVTGDDAVAADDHSGDDHATDDHAVSAGTDADPLAAAPWPRPWDPADDIDVSGVDGVSIEQELRATELIEGSLANLPKYADTAAAIADGYASIGDAGTGSEHYIKGAYIEDDVILDPTQPESLVYTVVGEERILAGAMYIASSRPVDDSELTEFAGHLMQWHKHDNLCWDIGDDGKAKVVGIIDDDGNCARGVRAGGENPMVHVWITPHPCGVFAALEGIGAGTAAVSDDERADMCLEDHHGDDGDESTSVAPVPYDPTKPIDLGGVDGVTPEQQARAENLVAVTLVDLPQWSDHTVAEAAGFHTIGDGFTGHEHFIQWDWIDDDIWLDPDFPESLVYAPQPDGSKKLVAAMYMLPRTVALDDVPDIGGSLTQWHIHDNLCYTNDPVAPLVAGLTDANGNCAAGLQKFDPPSPMIHVWITPHPCGPFAALEGVAGGQIKPGEERLCDTAHGAGDH